MVVVFIQSWTFQYDPGTKLQIAVKLQILGFPPPPKQEYRNDDDDNDDDVLP